MDVSKKTMNVASITGSAISHGLKRGRQGVVAEEAKGVGVIFGGFGEWSDFGFAEVESDGMGGPEAGLFALGQGAGHDFGTGIVEAHAIDEGLIGNGAEEAGRGIAGLGMPGDAAQFAKAKTERGPDGDGLSEFVHTGGEADGVGKF